MTKTDNSNKTYWAVCRTFSNRVHRVMPEIEKTNHGTFLPTYARVWSSGGKLSARERVLFPGYLFFQTKADGWAEVSEIDGVDGVLAHGERASRVTDAEMVRMVISHATREHDERDTTGLERATRRKRYRRPRQSRRARAAV
jgi:transcription antitermination factor NusG